MGECALLLVICRESARLPAPRVQLRDPHRSNTWITAARTVRGR